MIIKDTLTVDERHTLRRLCDPINAKGLWFLKNHQPSTLVRLVRLGLITLLEETMIEVCYVASEAGHNLNRSVQ